MMSVFLSASVPLPHRDEKYMRTADPVAIRDSIRALVAAVIPIGRLIFGGHPAITPLISLLVLQMKENLKDRITVYQSRYFADLFPPELGDLPHIKLIDSVVGSREGSLKQMRFQMIARNHFDAAVFIGGMDGVEEEYSMFREFHPNAPAYPIASTGAAALNLFKRYASDRPELLSDLRYLSLFRRILGARQYGKRELRAEDSED